jgi:radical SAM protein with 4Fe4S-binding SPASM domain
LGLDYRFDPVLNLRLDGGDSPAAYRISPEEVVALDLADAERAKAWREFCDRFWGPPPQPDLLYQCGAGQGTFHIDAEGRLSACMMARQPSFALRRGTFHEGWHTFMPQVTAQRSLSEADCRHCELTSLCGQCPGWSQLEAGDQEAQVDYLCRIAHLRAEAFGPNHKA